MLHVVTVIVESCIPAFAICHAYLASITYELLLVLMFVFFFSYSSYEALQERIESIFQLRISRAFGEESFAN